MKKNISIEKILLIAYFIILGIYQLALYYKSPWDTTGLTVNQIQNTNIIVKSFPFFAFIILIIFIAYRIIKKIPKNLFFPILILIIFGVIWIGYTVFFDKVSITVLIRSNTTPVIMIMPILILIGYDHKWWELLKKVFMIIACLSVVFAFYECIQVFLLFGFAQRATASAAMYLTILGFYSTYSIVVLTDEWLKNRKILILFLLIILLLNSGILQGRSWFLQIGILFLIYILRVKNSFDKFDIKRVIIPVFIILVTSLIVVINFDFFLGLIYRFETSGDTRTFQLVAFFEQVGFNKLLVGQGIYANYTFRDDTNFRFIDNQVLLIMFRYGIIPIILYLWLLLSPVFKSFYRGNKKLMIKSVILISWFLSMLGVSVFFNVTFNLAHSIILLSIGRLYYELKISNRGVNKL